MSRYTIDGQILSNMADAIRSKTSMTEIRTTLASVDIYKTANFIDFDNYEAITTSNASPIGDTDSWTSHIVKIPGAVKMSVKYQWYIASTTSGCYLYPFEKQGADRNYEISTSSPGKLTSKTFEDTDTVSIYWRNRGATESLFSMFAGKKIGFYFEIVGLDADNKPILLEDDPNPVEVQYEAFHDMTPAEMVEEVNNMMPGPLESELVMTGYSGYRFAYNNWNWVIDKYGDKIITKDVNYLY